MRLFVTGLTLALLAATGTAAAATGSQTFTTTGENVFTVPAGVTSVQVTLVGGTGGNGWNTPGDGGRGATALATIAVTPGERLFAEVAGNGGIGGLGYPGQGGAGGGGNGGYAGNTDGAGGGGGASDIRSCSLAACPNAAGLAARLVVAGGGGGGGDDSSGTILGGPGGNGGVDGQPGATSGGSHGGGGGQAGGATTGGGGGTSYSYPSNPGLLGQGGAGANSDSLAESGGGGGGGGLYGGGGGGTGQYTNIGNTPYLAGGGGGGGGSSGVPAGAQGVSGFGTNPTPANTQPQITFSWTLPAPAAVAGAPTGISGASGTLTGTVNPDGSLITDCHFVLQPGSIVIPCIQQVGSGSVPAPVTASAGGLIPGATYTVTLVATSAQGTSTSAPVTFAAGPPSLSSLKASPARFRRGKGTATISARTGTTISFQLSAAATVSATFAKPLAGRIVGGRCVAGAKPKGHPKRCTAYQPQKSGVARTAHAGANELVFSGTLDGGKPLAPGTYLLSLIASGPGGSSPPAQIAITVLR